MRIILIALALTLAGCAKTVWDKPGATAVNFEQDKNECVYQAKLGTPNQFYIGTGGAIAAGIAEGMREIELQNLCMQARGYTRRTVQN